MSSGLLPRCALCNKEIDKYREQVVADGSIFTLTCHGASEQIHVKDVNGRDARAPSIAFAPKRGSSGLLPRCALCNKEIDEYREQVVADGSIFTLTCHGASEQIHVKDVNGRDARAPSIAFAPKRGNGGAGSSPAGSSPAGFD